MPAEDAQQPLLEGQHQPSRVSLDVRDIVIGDGQGSAGAFPGADQQVDPARCLLMTYSLSPSGLAAAILPV